MDLHQQVKSRLAEAGVSLAVVARVSGLDYSRVQRVLAGHAKPKPLEGERLLAAIDAVSSLYPKART